MPLKFRTGTTRILRQDGDLDKDALQRDVDNISSTLKQVTRASIIDGILLKDVELVIGTNLVPHGLGRIPSCYIITYYEGQPFAVVEDRTEPNRDRILRIDCQQSSLGDLCSTTAKADIFIW